ncbi:hypothetical protein TNCV_892081 [Trichonephila clavipes]|nr:hypothetical protein TNCV_892081 [Trichonephila clavipes]
MGEERDIKTSEIPPQGKDSFSIIKRALNTYHNRAVENSSDILLFSDSRSTLQVILKGKFQLTRDIITIKNRVVAAQRTLQWTPANVAIFANEHADNFANEAQNSPQLSNSLSLTDADA